MLADYSDIRSRIKDEPLWWDSDGVPRYDRFTTDLCPNIYAHEIILMEISCQDCRQRFLVEMNWDIMATVFNNPRRHSERFSTVVHKWLKAKDKDRWPPFHYGDPPRHGCVGDTMNCYDLRIVEFWKRKEKGWGWERVTKYEIELEKEE